MNRLCLSLLTAVFAITLLDVPQLAAQQDAAAPDKAAADKAAADKAAVDKTAVDTAAAADQKDREQKLAEYLSGIKFVGKFTIDGKKEAAPKTEEYTISKCEKLSEADMYRMTARIKYGDVDSEVPLDLKILWSGNTPVITLDAFWIPGMGTFNARVLIDSGRYAGTWQHGEVGGHMFGLLKKD